MSQQNITPNFLYFVFLTLKGKWKQAVQKKRTNETRCYSTRAPLSPWIRQNLNYYFGTEIACLNCIRYTYLTQAQLSKEYKFQLQPYWITDTDINIWEFIKKKKKSYNNISAICTFGCSFCGKRFLVSSSQQLLSSPCTQSGDSAWGVEVSVLHCPPPPQWLSLLALFTYDHGLFASDVLQPTPFHATVAAPLFETNSSTIELVTFSHACCCCAQKVWRYYTKKAEYWNYHDLILLTHKKKWYRCYRERYDTASPSDKLISADTSNLNVLLSCVGNYLHMYEDCQRWAINIK